MTSSQHEIDMVLYRKELPLWKLVLHPLLLFARQRSSLCRLVFFLACSMEKEREILTRLTVDVVNCNCIELCSHGFVDIHIRMGTMEEMRCTLFHQLLVTGTIINDPFK